MHVVSKLDDLNVCDMPVLTSIEGKYIETASWLTKVMVRWRYVHVFFVILYFFVKQSGLNPISQLRIICTSYVVETVIGLRVNLPIHSIYIFHSYIFKVDPHPFVILHRRRNYTRTSHSRWNLTSSFWPHSTQVRLVLTLVPSPI